jgi:putative ABC transport system ATP-binding protein
VDISKLDAYELAWLRCRRIGYIFQNFNLITVLSAQENVALPTVFAGLSRSEGMEKAAKLLRSVGLGERLNHKPSQLSAGQQQRVAIARALANDPVIILADEPTGNLDLRTGTEIIDLLHGLNKTRGLTLVAATHDMKMITASNRVIYMRDGQVEKIDSD